MAAQAARGLGKQLIRLNCRSILQFRHGNGLMKLYSIRGLEAPPWPPWLCRTISHYPRTQYQSTRPKNRTQIEEEEEYEVEEEDLEELRKQHRAAASGSHSSQQGKQFDDFPLNLTLCSRLQELGYSEPFEIQARTLEHTLTGRDVIAKALTGSGKTLAFSVPIVHKLLERGNARSNRNPKAIVISPTRELCMQIYRSIQELDSRVRCVAVYGGDSIDKQERKMRRGVDVICATPGRLNDHIERGNIGLNELEFLCLDEADELLTPGFKEQIENVLETSPSSKQVMLFSATMPPHIKAITREYMNDPVHVDITANQKYKAPESVRHLCMRVPESQHLFMVKSLVNEHNPERCIVFMETKQKTRDAAHLLRRNMGLQADGIHSDLSQSRRENIMAAFRAGVIKVLVATDVAARGLDIPEVDLVVQVSPPRNGTEYYIHRSGRTGRAGRDGLAVLLHTGSQLDRMAIREIEKLAKVEHIDPPNQAALMEDAAKVALTQLERRAENRTTKALLPLVENLNLTPERASQLLAAALSAVVNRSDLSNQSSAEPGYSSQRTGPSYQRTGPRTGQRNKTYRGLRQWDEEDPSPRAQRDGEYRIRSPRTSGSSDWSKFY